MDGSAFDGENPQLPLISQEEEFNLPSDHADFSDPGELSEVVFDAEDSDESPTADDEVPEPRAAEKSLVMLENVLDGRRYVRNYFICWHCCSSTWSCAWQCFCQLRCEQLPDSTNSCSLFQDCGIETRR